MSKRMSRTDLTPPLVLAYQRIVNSSKTYNQLLALNVLMENTLTTQEWGQIERYLSSRFKATWKLIAKTGKFRTDIVKLAGRNSKRLNQVLIFHQSKENRAGLIQPPSQVPFVRISHQRGYSHYAHGSGTSTQLVVVWTGSGRRPHMPLAPFLEAVEPLVTDVLVLRAPKGATSYNYGVHGMGKNLDEVFHALRYKIKGHGYLKTYVIGTCMGTPPALLSLRELEATAVHLSSPIDPRRSYPEAFSEFLDGLENLSLRTVVSVGENSKRALKFAQEISRLIPCQLVISKKTGHNPLWPQAQSGNLRNWLVKYLFQIKP